MTITITPTGQACGAHITGLDVSQGLTDEQIDTIKSAWAEHHVLSFPDQHLSDEDLLRFTQYFGSLGDDPYFRPIKGQQYIAAIERKADEKAPVFAESWHCDWSFAKNPPIGTCLYAKIIPPKGGDTLFANQHRAYAQMPDDLKQRINGLTALHSAAAAYSPEGIYGEEDPELGRAMKPIISKSARAVEEHPLVMTHRVNGQKSVYGCYGYTCGIADMDKDAAAKLLAEIYAWQISADVIYTHIWHSHMLVMWDNYSVLHRATGGYDGHDRLLHRTTIWPA